MVHGMAGRWAVGSAVGWTSARCGGCPGEGFYTPRVRAYGRRLPLRGAQRPCERFSRVRGVSGWSRAAEGRSGALRLDFGVPAGALLTSTRFEGLGGVHSGLRGGVHGCGVRGRRSGGFRIVTRDTRSGVPLANVAGHWRHWRHWRHHLSPVHLTQLASQVMTDHFLHRLYILPGREVIRDT